MRQSPPGELIREALAAARDVTSEAVRFAEDTNLIERVRDNLRDELERERQRLGVYQPGQTKAPVRRPSVHQFVRALYSCRTRGEMRALMEQQPTLQQDWEDIKVAYGGDLDQDFIDSLDDALDMSKKTLNRKRLEEACQKVVYPLRWGQ